ncbi:hypothetical protein GS575_07325 [Rhodococcus hoagii]|nr:hypothetical protein [Prescottella equi]
MSRPSARRCCRHLGQAGFGFGFCSVPITTPFVDAVVECADVVGGLRCERQDDQVVLVERHPASRASR